MATRWGNLGGYPRQKSSLRHFASKAVTRIGEPPGRANPACLSELYLEGDLDKRADQTRRRELVEQLASLPAGTDQSGDEVGRTLAAYLADVSVARAAATPEDRNLLARQLLSVVAIENRTAVAIKPRSDLLPFF